MPDTWVTDMRHYLDSEGQVGTLPISAHRLRDQLGGIVRAATSNPLKAQLTTNVQCRRRPRHRRCDGEIRARFDENINILWECSSCGDRGLIHGWQNTVWDRLYQK
jgi:hypothetical protein